MEKHHPVNHLLRPLLHPSTTISATAFPSLDSSIILRLSLVFFIGILSIWANHEASKGFPITIVNNSGDNVAGRRFHLFYISNDEATRQVIKASKIIENFLYPDSLTKKPIKGITLKLADHNLIDNVTIDSNQDHEFVLEMSPSLIESKNFRNDVVLTVRRGVARIWLYDGQGNYGPKDLIDGIVEYLVNIFGADAAEPPQSAAVCWKRDDPREVAEFLSYRERRRPGFVRQLNQAMKDGWDDKKLGGTLGLPGQNLCTTHEPLRYNISSV